jgi:transposase
MLKEKEAGGVALDSLKGARITTGGVPSAATEVKRWSAGRKKEVVLRLLRGEPVDALSREVAVPIYKLEQWRDRALAGIDVGLKERENDPVVKQLDEANRRIGELVMEVEILQKERRAKRPLVGRRSSR